MSARIIVRLLADGQIEARTEAVTGPNCLDYIKILEDLLGAETVQSTFTPDYAAQSSHEATVQETRHDEQSH